MSTTNAQHKQWFSSTGTGKETGVNKKERKKEVDKKLSCSVHKLEINWITRNSSSSSSGV